MLEAQTWERSPIPKARSESIRKAFQALKLFDREIAKSDPLLLRIEAAFREQDTETLLWLSALALSHMLERGSADD